MNIALLGYGKMGHAIEEVARERGHHISHRITAENRETLKPENLKDADVVIEFSVPEAAIANVAFCLDAQKPVVVGTTGWYDEMEKVKRMVFAKDGTLLYASNFSVGVNLFFGLNKVLSRWMNKNQGYSAHIEETHHIHKKDAPSGTAVSLANDLIEVNNAYTKWSKFELSEEIPFSAGVLPVGYSREDEVPGTHRVIWESDIDRISITHEAFNRKGFALGAVLAAEFIADKKGFFTTEDLFKFEA